MTNGVPGKQFSFGAMRHRVTIQVPDKKIAGSGQSVKKWVDWITNEPADFRETGGGEIIRGKQIEAGITAVFLVNFREEYCSEMRVVFDGKVFGIVRCPAVEGERRYRDLHCKAVA